MFAILKKNDNNSEINFSQAFLAKIRQLTINPITDFSPNFLDSNHKL